MNASRKKTFKLNIPHHVNLEISLASKTPLKLRHKSSFEKIQASSKHLNRTQRKRPSFLLNDSFTLVQSFNEIKNKETLAKILKPFNYRSPEVQRKNLELIGKMFTGESKSNKRLKYSLPPIQLKSQFLKSLETVKSRYFGNTQQTKTERFIKDRLLPKKFERKSSRLKLMFKEKGDEKDLKDEPLSKRNMLSGWEHD